LSTAEIRVGKKQFTAMGMPPSTITAPPLKDVNNLSRSRSSLISSNTISNGHANSVNNYPIKNPLSTSQNPTLDQTSFVDLYNENLSFFPSTMLGKLEEGKINNLCVKNGQNQHQDSSSFSSTCSGKSNNCCNTTTTSGDTTSGTISRKRSASLPDTELFVCKKTNQLNKLHYGNKIYPPLLEQNHSRASSGHLFSAPASSACSPETVPRKNAVAYNHAHNAFYQNAEQLRNALQAADKNDNKMFDSTDLLNTHRKRSISLTDEADGAGIFLKQNKKKIAISCSVQNHNQPLLNDHSSNALKNIFTTPMTSRKKRKERKSSSSLQQQSIENDQNVMAKKPFGHPSLRNRSPGASLSSRIWRRLTNPGDSNDVCNGVGNSYLGSGFEKTCLTSAGSNSGSPNAPILLHTLSSNRSTAALPPQDELLDHLLEETSSSYSDAK
jgi:hypothetical protein